MTLLKQYTEIASYLEYLLPCHSTGRLAEIELGPGKNLPVLLLGADNVFRFVRCRVRR